jgi:PBSX family phage terminase large subunit
VVYGGEYVVARQNMPELRRTTMKQFLEVCPKEIILEHRVADAEVTIKSQNGTATFYFVGLEEPGKLDSLNLSGFGIDESSYTTEEAFLKLQGRLRNPKGLRKGLLVGNPKGHNWVYRYFVAKKGLQPEAHSQYKMIVAPSTENVHLPSGYIEGMLSSYSPERIKRDIYGSFDSFEGMIYSEFDRLQHVVEPFKIPEHWTRVVGVDHGFTNPTCFLWGAVDGDGNVYIYREFYESNWRIEQICRGNEKTGEPGVIEINNNEQLDGIYIDPSTRATRGQTGASDWDSYMDHFPDSWSLLQGKNDVTTGIDRVKSYLKIDPVAKKPKLFIFRSCANLLEEMSEYQWKELPETRRGKVNEKEQPRKYKDHAMDALRYLIMSRPEPAPTDKDWYKKHKIKHNSLEGSLRS